MGRPIINTARLEQLNPEYAEAIAQGEPWSLKHAERCRSINAGEPESARREFDGKPRKWCGEACSSPDGCVVCTLPENSEVVRQNRRYKYENEATNLFDSELAGSSRTSSEKQLTATTKVLLQQWRVPSKGSLFSISRNRTQLAATKRKVQKDGGRSVGSAQKVEIPNDHAFAEMIEDGTVFLHPDEMDVISGRI